MYKEMLRKGINLAVALVFAFTSIAQAMPTGRQATPVRLDTLRAVSLANAPLVAQTGIAVDLSSRIKASSAGQDIEVIKDFLDDVESGRISMLKFLPDIDISTDTGKTIFKKKYNVHTRYYKEEAAILREEARLSAKIQKLESNLFNKPTFDDIKNLITLRQELRIVMKAKAEFIKLGWACRHSHTNFEGDDGKLSPEELVDLALENGITSLYVTGHNTMAGSLKAIEYARMTNCIIDIRPGVEIEAPFENDKHEPYGYMHWRIIGPNDEMVIRKMRKWAEEINTSMLPALEQRFQKMLALGENREFFGKEIARIDGTKLQNFAEKAIKLGFIKDNDRKSIENAIFEWFQHMRNYIRENFSGENDKYGGSKPIPKWNNRSDVTGNWTDKVIALGEGDEVKEKRRVLRNVLTGLYSDDGMEKAAKQEAIRTEEMLEPFKRLGCFIIAAHPGLNMDFENDKDSKGKEINRDDFAERAEALARNGLLHGLGTGYIKYTREDHDKVLKMLNGINKRLETGKSALLLPDGSNADFHKPKSEDILRGIQVPKKGTTEGYWTLLYEAPDKQAYQRDGQFLAGKMFPEAEELIRQKEYQAALEKLNAILSTDPLNKKADILINRIYSSALSSDIDTRIQSADAENESVIEILKSAGKNKFINMVDNLYKLSRAYLIGGLENQDIDYDLIVTKLMTEIALKELDKDDTALKNAITAALLHDISYARTGKLPKLRVSDVNAAPAGLERETKRKEAIQMRQAHMAEGAALAVEILKVFNSLPKELRGDISFSKKDIADVEDVIAIHDNPSIQELEDKNDGQWLLPVDNQLAKLLREADRLYMLTIKGIEKDLKSDAKNAEKKGKTIPRLPVSKIAHNTSRHSDEKALYDEAFQKNNPALFAQYGFKGSTLYRSEAGYKLYQTLKRKALDKYISGATLKDLEEAIEKAKDEDVRERITLAIAGMPQSPDTKASSAGSETNLSTSPVLMGSTGKALVKAVFEYNVVSGQLRAVKQHPAVESTDFVKWQRTVEACLQQIFKDISLPDSFPHEITLKFSSGLKYLSELEIGKRDESKIITILLDEVLMQPDAKWPLFMELENQILKASLGSLINRAPAPAEDAALILAYIARFNSFEERKRQQAISFLQRHSGIDKGGFSELLKDPQDLGMEKAIDRVIEYLRKQKLVTDKKWLEEALPAWRNAIVYLSYNNIMVNLLRQDVFTITDRLSIGSPEPSPAFWSTTDWANVFNRTSARLTGNPSTQKVEILLSNKNNGHKKLSLRIPQPDRLTEREYTLLARFLCASIMDFLVTKGFSDIEVISSDSKLKEAVKEIMSTEYEKMIDYLKQYYNNRFKIVYEGRQSTTPFYKENTIIGLDLGGSAKVKGVVIENGKVVFSESYKLPMSAERISSTDEYTSQFKMIIEEVIKASGKKKEDIFAVGISWAGAINEKGQIAATSKIVEGVEKEEKNLRRIRDLASYISKEAGIPVYLVNDGDAIAFGLATYAEKTDTLCMGFGTSLAAGYIDEDGKLATGLGEGSKIIIDMADKAGIHTGRNIKGVAQQYTSEKGVIRVAEGYEEFRKLLKTFETSEKAQRIGEEVELYNEDGERVIEKVADYIAVAVHQFHRHYKMENVILSGGVMNSESGQIILDKVREKIRSRYPVVNPTNIETSAEIEKVVENLSVGNISYPTFANAIGAAQFANQQHLEKQAKPSTKSSSAGISKDISTITQDMEQMNIAFTYIDASLLDEKMLSDAITLYTKAIDSLKTLNISAQTAATVAQPLQQAEAVLATITLSKDIAVKEADIKGISGTIIVNDTDIPDNQKILLTLLDKNNNYLKALQEKLGCKVRLLSQYNPGTDLSASTIAISKQKITTIPGLRYIGITTATEDAYIPLEQVIVFAKGLLSYTKDTRQALDGIIADMYRLLTKQPIKPHLLEEFLNSSVFSLSLPQPVPVDEKYYEQLHKQAMAALIAA